jgi:hypothetical protein
MTPQTILEEQVKQLEKLVQIQKEALSLLEAENLRLKARHPQQPYWYNPSPIWCGTSGFASASNVLAGGNGNTTITGICG